MCSCSALRQCTPHSACRWACCTGVCFTAGWVAPGCCMLPAVWPPAQTGSCSEDAPPLHRGWTSRGVLVFGARTLTPHPQRAGGQTDTTHAQLGSQCIVVVGLVLRACMLMEAVAQSSPLPLQSACRGTAHPCRGSCVLACNTPLLSARCCCPDHQCSAACLQTLSPDRAEMQKCTGAQVRQLLGITRGGQEALIALALLTGGPAPHSLPCVLHCHRSPAGVQCTTAPGNLRWRCSRARQAGRGLPQLALLSTEAGPGELAPPNVHAGLPGVTQPWKHLLLRRTPHMHAWAPC